MGNTALATDVNVIHALGDLIPFPQVNIFLPYRQQHQLFDACPKKLYKCPCYSPLAVPIHDFAAKKDVEDPVRHQQLWSCL